MEAKGFPHALPHRSSLRLLSLFNIRAVFSPTAYLLREVTWCTNALWTCRREKAAHAVDKVMALKMIDRCRSTVQAVPIVSVSPSAMISATILAGRATLPADKRGTIHS